MDVFRERQITKSIKSPALFFCMIPRPPFNADQQFLGLLSEYAVLETRSHKKVPLTGCHPLGEASRGFLLIRNVT